MKSLAVTAYTATSAAGHGNSAFAASLVDRRSGLRPNDFTSAPLETFIGRVDGLETFRLPATLANWDCRNNRLAFLGLQADGFLDAVAAARRRHGPGRIALVVGTSTASIGATEEAYSRLTPECRFPPDLRRPAIHEISSLAEFLVAATGLDGPTLTVSTACSSSAKVFAQAERLIRLGIVDAAVVGGVDTLCGNVLFGFHSLQLVAPGPCRPFDIARQGINLGEAAGFALLERDGDAAGWLLGHGESSDAHHMSSPHPEGLGAKQAIAAALGRAGLVASDIGYVNLHGTASQANDAVEARVVAELFTEDCLAGSTKGWTGHTLGTAGILESIVCLLALEGGFRPGTLNCSNLDPACGPQLRPPGDRVAVAFALTESFGFGGNNSALVFGRSPT